MLLPVSWDTKLTSSAVVVFLPSAAWRYGGAAPRVAVNNGGETLLKFAPCGSQGLVHLLLRVSPDFHSCRRRARGMMFNVCVGVSQAQKSVYTTSDVRRHLVAVTRFQYTSRNIEQQELETWPYGHECWGHDPV